MKAFPGLMPHKMQSLRGPGPSNILIKVGRAVSTHPPLFYTAQPMQRGARLHEAAYVDYCTDCGTDASSALRRRTSSWRARTPATAGRRSSTT
jgi:hypothetical protein